VDQNPSEKDPSQLWPIFTQENRTDDIENILISTLYKASLQAINNDQSSLPKIIHLFENYPWAILRRLTLYLLSLYPMASYALNTKYIANRDLFQNFPSEYYLSLQSAFGQLPTSEQNQILDWFNDVPDDHPDHWQRHWLTAIIKNLPDNWRARYDQLIQSLGEPNAFVYHSPIETYAWWGDGSPKTADDLLNMSMDGLFEYLTDWQPSDELLGASKDGLGIQLRSIVTNAPDRFAPEAARFLTVSPIYVNSFLSGLRDACSNRRSFSWFPVLELCLEIINEISGNSSQNISEEWSWVRAEISDLVREGCEKDEIDFAYRELTWSVLVALVDQFPNRDDEYAHIDHNMTSLELSYNTYRGRALHAVIQYLFWVQRQLRRLSNDSTNFAMSSEMVPEVITLLDQQILDNSLAVKAVFGRYIPWFDLLDGNWLAQNLKHIFVDDDISWAAAWSAYVTTCNPYEHNFTLLRSEYFRAVNTIATYDVESTTRKSTHYIKHLIWHIMVFYERGLLNLNEPDGLLQLFYHAAPDEMCAYAIQNVGQGLKNSTEPISEEILLRLYELWQYRLEQAQLAPQVHVAELLAFSWWFVSGKLDPKWSIEQLKQVLSHTGDSKVVLADSIVESLTTLVENMPQEVVDCLDIIVERTKELWNIDIWENDVRIILTTALNSSNMAAYQKSTAIINKLAARGYMEFVDLLS
jgi:hypothetical protein